MKIVDISNNKEYYKIIYTPYFPTQFSSNSREYKQCVKLYPLADIPYNDLNNKYILVCDKTNALISTIIQSNCSCQQKRCHCKVDAIYKLAIYNE